MNIEKLLQDFKDYKVNVEGKSSKSIDWYIRHINEFCKDMDINDYNTLININSQTIKDWLSILVDRGNQPSSRNNKLSAVKQLFVFLEEEKDEDIDRKINKIKLAKITKKETKYADETQMEQLLVSTTEQRTKSAIAILNSTGVRFCEMIQITCSDIDRGFAVIVGKGNKERTIWFPPSCIKICKDYINGKRKKIIEKTKVETDLLFISNKGNVIDPSNFTKSLKKSARRIGLYWSDEMSPHKLRHSCLTKKLNNGTPIHIVRDMAGHTNIQTTDRYSHTNEDMVRQYMLDEDK